MAELTINPKEISDALKSFASSYEPGKADATEVGTVVDAADGIAHVEGLPGCMANELVRFSDGTLGIAQNLDENETFAFLPKPFSLKQLAKAVKETMEH